MKGPYFEICEMRCIFKVHICEPGDPLGSERMAVWPYLKFLKSGVELVSGLKH